MNVQQLENELWEAADQLRANSKLTAAEYSMPVLGLIFLRHADNRFKAYLPDIEADIPPQVPAAQREALIKLGLNLLNVLGIARIHPLKGRLEPRAELFHLARAVVVFDFLGQRQVPLDALNMLNGQHPGLIQLEKTL